MMREESLGIYSGFPERCHHAFFLGINVPVPDAQKALVCMMYELNGRSVKDQWSRSVGTDIDVIFEFGVADGLIFHYINSDTLNLLLKTINEREIRMLDFICIIRYYMRGARRNGKRRALRFDYYFLRFIFSNRHLKIRVFHEKGPQRISAREIIEFLVENISPVLTDETDVSG
ncbi:MAG: hypothetical protein QW702_03470 [Candidatus Bathyarchaeia archaeon]